MCLIIVSREGKKIPEKHLERGFEDNPHGFGVMWFDRKEKKTKHYKAFKWRKLISCLENEVKDNPHCVHFRWSTGGKIDWFNCHPFTIDQPETLGKEPLLMMHNGIINIQEIDPRYNDTWHYCRHLEQYGFNDYSLESKEVKDAVEKQIGGGNKLVFMTPSGKIHILNEHCGTWREGLWYSNSNAFRTAVTYVTSSTYNNPYAWYEDEYGYATYTKESNIRNKRHYKSWEEYVADKYPNNSAPWLNRDKKVDKHLEEAKQTVLDISGEEEGEGVSPGQNDYDRCQYGSALAVDSRLLEDAPITRKRIQEMTDEEFDAFMASENADYQREYLVRP